MTANHSSSDLVSHELENGLQSEVHRVGGLKHSPTKIDIVPPPIPAPEEAREGLLNSKALLILVLWYLFSISTLFLNKYILTTLKAEAVFFGEYL